MRTGFKKRREGKYSLFLLQRLDSQKKNSKRPIRTKDHEIASQQKTTRKIGGCGDRSLREGGEGEVMPSLQGGSTTVNCHGKTRWLTNREEQVFAPYTSSEGEEKRREIIMASKGGGET